LTLQPPKLLVSSYEGGLGEAVAPIVPTQDDATVGNPAADRIDEQLYVGENSFG